MAPEIPYVRRLNHVTEEFGPVTSEDLFYLIGNFPEPEGPMIATNSPLFISRLIPSTARIIELPM